MKKKILLTALVFCILLCIAPSAFAETKMKVGETKYFSCNTSTTIYSWTGNKWTSSDPSVVRVSPNGDYGCNVTALKPGTATVSAAVSYRYGNRGQYSDTLRNSWNIVVTSEGSVNPTPQPTTQPTTNYTIRYYANGGSGAPSSQSKQEGVSITLSTTQPTREGYVFQGWATSSTATTASYQPGDRFSGNYNLSLYAVWQFDHYVIKYDANGGTGAPANQNKAKGQSVMLSTVKPTHSSNTVNYTITLNANGGSVNPSSLTATKTTQYTFNNWNTISGGYGTSYASGASYSIDASVTLYAQWSSSATTSSVVLPTPTREGWSFKGWATSSGANTGFTGSYNPSGNVTLYAVWETSGEYIGYDSYYQWILRNDGHLTVSGSGTIRFKGWENYKDSIKTVTINSGITGIGYFSFADCSNLTSVTIPNGVTLIGEDAFRNTKLTNVIIPEGVTSIERNAFYDCGSLTSVTLPSSLKTIGSFAFDKCDSLTGLTIPNSVNTIGSYAFSFCSSLTSLTIPDSVNTIDSHAFSNCSSLRSVTLPMGLSRIPEECFSDCKSLTSLTIPDSVKIIDSAAFSYCTGLTDITLPAGLSKIPYLCFNNCKSLKSLTIPGSVEGIEQSAFAGCESLSAVTICEGVKSIGVGAFLQCEKLETLSIPVSMTSVGNYAFYNSQSMSDIYYAGTSEQWKAINIDSGNTPLKTTTIHYNHIIYDFFLPTSLTVIGDEAFANGAFRCVKLPKNAVSIGWHAFADCPNLVYIFIPASTTDIDAQAFGNMQGLTIVGVPGSKAATYARNHGFAFIAAE